jgi:hypothetical protein
MWWDQIQHIMTMVCEDDGLPTVKLHGLRMLATAILEHIPLSSADSAMVAWKVNRDCKWSGTFAPRTKAGAIALRDRIEDAPWVTAWKHFRCEQGPKMDLQLEDVDK